MSKEFVDLLNREMDSLVDDYAKRRISDLEAKLAESEVRAERNKDWHNEAAGECAELKQQLADKEKKLSEALAKQSITCLNTIKKAYQDKISFAVEQLEKVKEKILSYEEIYYQFLENGAKIPVFCVENFRVRQNIDNQITELQKEMKYDGKSTL